MLHERFKPLFDRMKCLSSFENNFLKYPSQVYQHPRGEFKQYAIVKNDFRVIGVIQSMYLERNRHFSIYLRNRFLTIKLQHSLVFKVDWSISINSNLVNLQKIMTTFKMTTILIGGMQQMMVKSTCRFKFSP